MSSPRHLLLFFLLTVLLVPALRCAPLPGRRDDGLIMGTDFLSLFIRQQQKASTTSSSSDVEEDTSCTEEQTTTTTEVALAVTQPNVQVSVRVSSSVSGTMPTTTSPDIFTTFLNAFSETAHSPSPSAAIRSPLTVEEPAYGTRLNRRRQFSSDSQSASEQIMVRFSPKTTPIPTPAKKLEPPKELNKNSELPEQLYEKLQTEKAYEDDNFAEELKLSPAYTAPETLYENKQAIADQLYGQHNNEVPESAPATQEGLQVFDKTLEAERVAASQKFGYVVEGRNYRKYRVEERTPDGFIVGEYGVVSHDDGQLRGVRYTADSTINPKLIYDALMNFLKL